MKQPIQGVFNCPLDELLLLKQGGLNDIPILWFGVASLILFFLIALLPDQIQRRVDIDLMQGHPIPASLLALSTVIGMLQSIFQNRGKFIVVPGSKLRFKLILEVGPDQGKVSIELSLPGMAQL